MDLKIGSIPLRITGRFFLMTLLLGLNERDPGRLAVWVAVVLVSVTVHEMGHALMGMAFGFKPAIELHGMGGHTTFGDGRWTTSTGRSILISLAGPFAGFALALVIVLVQVAGNVHPQNPLGQLALARLYQVNVGWGIFNLVPLLPLDGGNVFRSITKAISPTKGELVARVVSIIVAASGGLWALTSGNWWMVYLAAMFGFSNFQAIRGAPQQKIDSPLATAVEKSYAAINRNDYRGAIGILNPLLFSQRADPDLRRAGLEVYLVSLIKEKRTREAVEVLSREKNLLGPSELRRYAAVLTRGGFEEHAAQVEALVKTTSEIGEYRA